MLDVKDDFTIAKRIVYPGAKLEVKTNTLIEKHLLVIKGTGKKIIDSQSSVMDTGQAATLFKKQVADYRDSIFKSM